MNYESFTDTYFQIQEIRKVSARVYFAQFYTILPQGLGTPSGNLLRSILLSDIPSFGIQSLFLNSFEYSRETHFKENIQNVEESLKKIVLTSSRKPSSFFQLQEKKKYYFFENNIFKSNDFTSLKELGFVNLYQSKRNKSYENGSHLKKKTESVIGIQHTFFYMTFTTLKFKKPKSFFDSVLFETQKKKKTLRKNLMFGKFLKKNNLDGRMKRYETKKFQLKSFPFDVCSKTYLFHFLFFSQLLHDHFFSSDVLSEHQKRSSERSSLDEQNSCDSYFQPSFFEKKKKRILRQYFSSKKRGNFKLKTNLFFSTFFQKKKKLRTLFTQNLQEKIQNTLFFSEHFGYLEVEFNSNQDYTNYRNFVHLKNKKKVLDESVIEIPQLEFIAASKLQQVSNKNHETQIFSKDIYLPEHLKVVDTNQYVMTLSHIPFKKNSGIWIKFGFEPKLYLNHFLSNLFLNHLDLRSGSQQNLFVKPNLLKSKSISVSPLHKKKEGFQNVLNDSFYLETKKNHLKHLIPQKKNIFFLKKKISQQNISSFCLKNSQIVSCNSFLRIFQAQTQPSSVRVNSASHFSNKIVQDTKNVSYEIKCTPIPSFVRKVNFSVQKYSKYMEFLSFEVYTNGTLDPFSTFQLAREQTFSTIQFLGRNPFTQKRDL